MVKRVYADFQNLDSNGRVRLNTAGTQVDIANQGIDLQVGLAIRIYEDDLEADAIVEYSAEESMWVAKVDWRGVQDRP